MNSSQCQPRYESHAEEGQTETWIVSAPCAAMIPVTEQQRLQRSLGVAGSGGKIAAALALPAVVVVVVVVVEAAVVAEVAAKEAAVAVVAVVVIGVAGGRKATTSSDTVPAWMLQCLSNDKPLFVAVNERKTY